ncbi:FAD-binding protein [Fulvivirga imtechensis AK7]|uniref:FAD-binding protein n=1 Tax=Fulvivirga imtechensis AK7 TaxID=1237149 RepID=L8JQR8_9BACT|nr:NAD(P)/FAD-dependent oxidoreductase [Fulvivirga imtechensis]ELR71296.1 FAD-binding protein [Fulvivirga imtechensis AK7]
MEKNLESVDVLVIGAGPSGTVAASILNKNGYHVKIVEKQQFPRFVIGESLLPRCMHNLEKAGFIEAIEKGNFQKKLGAIFADGHETCEFDFSNQFSEGWGWTWQVQRGAFDHLLAREVERMGVKVEHGSAVTAVDFNEKHANATISKADGSTYNIQARFIVDSSGYGRVLPRLLNLDKPSDFPERTSFFCHLRPVEPIVGKEREKIIILVYTKDIWGWVIPFSDGTYSVGIVGDIEGVNQFSGDDEAQFRQWVEEIPALKSRFTNCSLIFPPKRITGYAAAVKKHYGHRFVLTGNSTEFLDPVFSSGVTFATESGALAAELVSKELSGEAVNWQKEYSEYIQRGVDVFKTFITAWYDGDLQRIFFSQNPNTEMRRQICSVLAGYVWDLDNPFVSKHKRAITSLARVV